MKRCELLRGATGQASRASLEWYELLFAKKETFALAALNSALYLIPLVIIVQYTVIGRAAKKKGYKE